MSVSTSFTDRDGGLELINDLWIAIRKKQSYDSAVELNKKLGRRYMSHSKPDIDKMYKLLIFAVHRLTFLEMVTKGLRYQEMHDAQAYAKFVQKKRNLEDMDTEELRLLLRTW